ncbi:MAG: hypothetical protein AN484_26290 [Aphanizomenon flos-aquae WA102]|uniref:Uncharacterized protein n=1 Tax=Aphanizomenon flos-aquae WA102 TaxID=1710896 RepID=A0A1B7WE06_APHFL|nr:MAG: hypothetical protein AN484_26290 [Aphanizomenon flos-aquae WA102]
MRQIMICRTYVAADFDLPHHMCGRSTFELEYLGEFETKIEKSLGCESGAYGASIDEKKPRSKI